MNSTDLEKRFNEEINKIDTEIKNTNWSDKKIYTEFLAQSYFLVRHTTRFLCLAAAKTEFQKRELHYEWIEHLNGERHHDIVLIQDLKELGSKPELHSESWPVRLIYQSNYYFIEHENSEALLGYALLLEGLAVHSAPFVLDQVEKNFGAKSAKFLNLHAKVDVGHYAEGIKVLNHLDKKAHMSILKNLEQSDTVRKLVGLISQSSRSNGLTRNK